MTAPLISVITPTFNSGAKFSATAASVLSQEAGLYEFLVVDGGSTDDTLTRLRNYGSALRWISEPDAGVYDAMNKGIRLSKGNFLYFLGAGDLVRPGAFAAVAAKVKERPPATPDSSRSLFLYGDVCWPEQGGLYDGPFNRLKIAVRSICHQAIFYQRSILERLGGFDVRFPTCADYALNIRCFGEPWIDPIYLDVVVADYEGGGLSAANVDSAFVAAWPNMVWQHLGWRSYLLLRWRFFIRPRLNPLYWARFAKRGTRALIRRGRAHLSR